MKLLVTGAAGFVGVTLVRGLLESRSDLEIIGLDNLYRPGSERNRTTLRALGVEFRHGDIRSRTDLDSLPKLDWVIDASALPSVLAGVANDQSSRQLMEHNLAGTINLLELCTRDRATFTILSTSRVYSIPDIAAVQLETGGDAFVPHSEQTWPAGISAAGISERCSTLPPVSLYGATKVCSERLALEYSSAFGFPTWINRCGVLAGAGQFGRAEQGIFSYWIHAFRARRPLRYIGFGGRGLQVRDCLHPRDLVPLLLDQFDHGDAPHESHTVNAAGGIGNSMSLRQLTEWCTERFGPHPVASDPVERPYDLGWIVLDPAVAEATWSWKPTTDMATILSEIADHADSHPDWLDLCEA